MRQEGGGRKQDTKKERIRVSKQKEYNGAHHKVLYN